MVVTYEQAEYGEALDAWVEMRSYYGTELEQNCVLVIESEPQRNPAQEVQQAADVLVILREVK